MKFLLTFFLLVIANITHAQRAQVLLLDEDLDGTDLEKNFSVHQGSTAHNALPDRDLREEVLSAVPAIAEWDELKKDIFFMDLASKTIPQLKKKYPELKESKIKMLKDKR